MATTTQQTGSGVLVGIDGSGDAKTALDWAVANQCRFGQVIPFLSYYVEPFVGGAGMPSYYGKFLDALKEQAHATVAETLGDQPDLLARARVVYGSAGPALVEAAASDDISLLVVGTRGHGRVARFVLGSVGSHCTKHSSVPVVVVPDDTTIARAGIERGAPAGDIVVGVDGSETSAMALQWAVDHRGPEGTVVAVGCVDPPSLDDSAGDGEAREAAMMDKISGVVSKVRAAIEQAGRQPGDIEARVEVGDPRMVLRRLAEDADLLVVGSRSRRGVPYLLLGSTATALLDHPAAPTVVVPDRD